MPRSMGDLAGSFARMPNAIEQGEYRGVKTAATVVTQSIRSEIRRVTGDMRLSGVGRSGAKVGAGYKPVKPTGDPTAYIRKRGPLQLIENDTQAHAIYPKGLTFSTTRKGNVRRRGRTRALKIGDGFATYADHPGTRGQHPFRRGWQKKQAEVPRIVQQSVSQSIVRSWA